MRPRRRRGEHHIGQGGEGIVPGQIGDGDVGEIGEVFALVAPQGGVAQQPRQQNQRNLSGHVHIRPIPRHGFYQFVNPFGAFRGQKFDIMRSAAHIVVQQHEEIYGAGIDPYEFI